MRVLQANKFFYVRGGSERYYFDLSDLLTKRGHEVFHFSMSHPRNEHSDQAAYFVSEVDLNAALPVRRRLKAALRVLYSFEARNKFGRLLDDLRPDVVHFHNITRQLSPSIVNAAATRGIPMIQTLHDVSIACPAHTFFVNGHICEDCAGGDYWHAVAKRCIDGSAGSSLLGAFEAYLHAGLGIYDKIGRFIAPSLFLKSKLSRLSWMAPKITHLPYFIPDAPDYIAVNEGYVLFAGRITMEKGISTLLEAAGKLKHVRFVLAGEGPLLEDSERFVSRRQINNVEFTGYVKGAELEGLLKGAGCVVVPSVWYENLPLTILGAFARGVPVVASARGGNPELVHDGVTGHLFEPGNADSLADSIDKTFRDETARSEMGRRARNLAAGEYSPAIHYDRLMSLYKGLCTWKCR